MLGRTKARTPTQPQKNIGYWDPGSLIKCWQQCFWQPQDCCFIALKSSQIFPVLDQDWYRLKEKILKICTWYPWVIEVGDYKSDLIKKTSVCNLFDPHYYTHLTFWIEQTSRVCAWLTGPSFSTCKIYTCRKSTYHMHVIINSKLHVRKAGQIIPWILYQSNKKPTIENYWSFLKFGCFV